MSYRHFDYVRAESCAEAVELLADGSCVSRLLAGGTDLLVEVHKTGATWDRLIDVGRIPELQAIAERPGAVSVGAAVTHAQAGASPLLRERLPLLADACRAIGTPQIRARGTVGGNVATAAVCADTVPALVCLGAIARVAAPDGESEQTVGDLVAGQRQAALAPRALIREFRIPAPAAGTRMAYRKLARRQGAAIARLSLACLGRCDAAGRVSLIRIVPGACTSVPARFHKTEAILEGQVPTEDLVCEAGRVAAKEMVELAGRRWSTAYKEVALSALVERALRAVFELPGTV